MNMRIKALLSIMWGLFLFLYIVTIGDIVRAWIDSGKSVIAELEASSSRDRIAQEEFEVRHKPPRIYAPKKPQLQAVNNTIADSTH